MKTGRAQPSRQENRSGRGPDGRSSRTDRRASPITRKDQCWLPTTHTPGLRHTPQRSPRITPCPFGHKRVCRSADAGAAFSLTADFRARETSDGFAFTNGEWSANAASTAAIVKAVSPPGPAAARAASTSSDGHACSTRVRPFPICGIPG